MSSIVRTALSAVLGGAIAFGAILSSAAATQETGFELLALAASSLITFFIVDVLVSDEDEGAKK